MQTVQVAVAIILNDEDKVLLALRSPEQHQGGLWEFPGGKVEAGESVNEALKREIREELNITITAAEPLLPVKHDYSDKSVCLDVWWVTDFQGTPQGHEGQKIRWCAICDLQEDEFPAANAPIISAIQANKRELLNITKRAKY
jgi:8-oxo-dGTP diphosphatase